MKKALIIIASVCLILFVSCTSVIAEFPTVGGDFALSNGVQFGMTQDQVESLQGGTPKEYDSSGYHALAYYGLKTLEDIPIEKSGISSNVLYEFDSTSKELFLIVYSFGHYDFGDGYKNFERLVVRLAEQYGEPVHNNDGQVIAYPTINLGQYANLIKDKTYDIPYCVEWVNKYNGYYVIIDAFLVKYDESVQMNVGFDYVSYDDMTQRMGDGKPVSLSTYTGKSTSGEYGPVNISPTAANNATVVEDKEILFRDTPWGISYIEADARFPEYSISSYLTGEMMKFYPTIQLYSDTYTKEFDFEYHDINIPATAWNREFNVAGYKTTGVTLHFAYKVIDGVITHNEEDTLMYGAQYEFTPVDSKAMVSDLKNKLSSLYGYIDDTGSRNLNGIWEYKWWIWKGTNNTAVSLTLKDKLENDDDEVWISYFTYDGDIWLKEASDGEKERLLREQQSAGSDDVSGL